MRPQDTATVHVQVMTNSDGGSLIPYTGADAASTREAIVQARVALARQRADIERSQADQRAELSRKREEFDRQRREMEAQFDKARAELESQMRPLQEQLAKMTEVMWSVDLYLGRDESLQLIRDGQPAPADTPITVRQKVLVMAEESLVLMGSGSTGMDADGVPEFISWLCADDENLSRVLPEQKGVVVLVPTRVKARSGNAFEDAARNDANSESFWLLRNGQRLYLLTVDPQLRLDDRILPNRTEFVEVFDQKLFGMRLGEPVRPGSDEWFELEKVADARRRHYMRVMLVLKGITDRTPVWHPLPEGGVDFMSVRDQDRGKIVLIQDGDQSRQLGEAGETFSQWQRRLNALLRPGLRVIGDWHSQGFREEYVRSEGYRRGYHPRLYPNRIESRPETGVPHLIEGRKDGGYVVRFERTDSIYKRNLPVPDQPGYVYAGEMPVAPKQRASCVVMASDDWVLPFDLITVPELERFLASREERSKHFLSMVPVIRAALEAKRAEAEAEREFRVLLGALLVSEGAEVSDAPALVEELVHWWKVSHTWSKPLNGDGPHEKKAADQIVAEYRARSAAAGDAAEDTIVEVGRTVPGVIAVARDRQGRWFAYAPSPGAHEAGVFLDITRIRRNGTIGETKAWQILATRTAAALHVAWQADEWAGWTHGQVRRQRLSEPERTALIAQAKEAAAAAGTVVCVIEFWNPKEPGDRRMRAYSWVGADPDDATVVPDDSAFGWRWKLSDPAIKARSWRVDTSGAHPALVEASSTGDAAFSKYTGGMPWWPDDATQYPDARPRLVWLNADFYPRVQAYQERCAEAARTRLQTRREAEAAAYRYVRPVEEAIHEAQVAAIRARFEEDYGRDADDLWDAHLKSITIKAPIHSRDLWALIATAQKRGEAVIGRTLDELADALFEDGGVAPGEWHHSRRNRVDTAGFGHLTVTDPEDESTSDHPAA